MTNYDLAWVVVVTFALLGAVGLYKLVPNMVPSFKVPLVATVLVLFLLPAPVPRFEGEFAPAFIVFVFEYLFQIDGEPNFAGGVLLVGGAVTLVLSFIGVKFVASRTRDLSAVEAQQDQD